MSGRGLTVHCSAPAQAHVIVGDTHAIPEGGAVIHLITLEQPKEVRERYLSLLDSTEIARMERFRFDADRERFLLGHGFLREVLGDYLHTNGASLNFERGPYGKPFLPGSGVHFNMSDTKDAIAVVVSALADIGLDIETMARQVDHVNVGGHYFTPEEQRSISEADDGKRRFLEFWTRKEAVLKASGVGIMDDLRVLRVDQAVNRMDITHPVFVEMAAAAYHVRTWHVGLQHIVSLATPTIVDRVTFLAPSR